MLEFETLVFDRQCVAQMFCVLHPFIGSGYWNRPDPKPRILTASYTD